MKNKIENLELSVIATYNEPQDIDGMSDNQEGFVIGITESALRSEEAIIDWVLAHLDGDIDDLVLLSLSWSCSQAIVDKYPAIKQSIYRNGKYAFNSWADEFSFKVDTFREFADYDRVVEELS